MPPPPQEQKDFVRTCGGSYFHVQCRHTQPCLHPYDHHHYKLHHPREHPHYQELLLVSGLSAVYHAGPADDGHGLLPVQPDHLGDLLLLADDGSGLPLVDIEHHRHSLLAAQPGDHRVYLHLGEERLCLPPVDLDWHARP